MEFSCFSFLASPQAVCGNREARWQGLAYFMATVAARKVCLVCCNQLADDNNLTNVYLAYTAEGAEQAMRPQTAKSGRPKTASKGRSGRRSALELCIAAACI